MLYKYSLAREKINSRKLGKTTVKIEPFLSQVHGEMTYIIRTDINLFIM